MHELRKRLKERYIKYGQGIVQDAIELQREQGGLTKEQETELEKEQGQVRKALDLSAQRTKKGE
jgi:hypothetical protein